eukprot:SAG22_NODE_8_length_37215_cov_120.960351_22_plen_160_part_00
MSVRYHGVDPADIPGSTSSYSPSANNGLQADFRDRVAHSPRPGLDERYRVYSCARAPRATQPTKQASDACASRLHGPHLSCDWLVVRRLFVVLLPAAGAALAGAAAPAAGDGATHVRVCIARHRGVTLLWCRFGCEHIAGQEYYTDPRRSAYLRVNATF